MSDPIVFVGRNRVKAGRAEEFRQHYTGSLAATKAEKTVTLVQLIYENEDASEVTVVRLFADADALDLQLQGADERSRRTFEFIEPLSVELYGTPNAATVEKMRHIAGSGIKVSISPK